MKGKYGEDHVNGFIITPAADAERLGQVDVLLHRRTCTDKNFDVVMPIAGGFLIFKQMTRDLYRLSGFCTELADDQKKSVLFDQMGRYVAENSYKMNVICPALIATKAPAPILSCHESPAAPDAH